MSINRTNQNVLVTRPDQAGADLVSALIERGHHAHQLTLFEFVCGDQVTHLAHDLQSLPPGSLVIFVSIQAFRFADQQIKGRWPSTLSYYAVGQSTAHAAQQAGLDSIQYPHQLQQSEGLLALLADVDMSEKQIVICRGNGGREHLFEQLQARGAHVRYNEVYQRVAKNIDRANLYDQWKNRPFTCIVVTSIEHFSQLQRVMCDYQDDWLSSCHYIAFSQRITDYLFQAGCTRVTTCDAPSNNAVIAAINAISKSEDYD